MITVIKTIAIVALILALLSLDFYGIWQANRAYEIMWDRVDVIQQIIGTAFIFVGGNYILAAILASVYALTAFIYRILKDGDQ